jgi:long-chain fatty acid transport protein
MEHALTLEGVKMVSSSKVEICLRGRKKKIFLGMIWLLIVFYPAVSAASGFRISNQSLGAVGLSGAHTAFTPGPDSSYYNPANMSYLSEQWQAETSLTLLHLPNIEYSDNRGSMFSGTSESELFFMPLLHLTSPEYGRLRYGFSLTYPYGLSKQWEQPYPRAFAENFSLLTVEANPTLAYEATDWFSVGGGLRVVYGKGEVENQIGAPVSPVTLRRSSEGTDTQLGYNVALSVRPVKQWSIGATYRSEVNLDLSGNSELQAYAGGIPLASYSGDGSVDITLPAVLTLATSYTFDRLTVEIGWDRTFWSSFRELDFNYDSNFETSLFSVFDKSIRKNWDDTDAFRMGLTYDWDERWTTTLGFSHDRTPVPADTLGFELPDSDAMVYCAGVRYRYSAATEVGISYMYHRTQSRSISQTDANSSGIEGRFTEGGAHALTFGVITIF